MATFCRVLAEGGRPEVHADRELSLVHVTDAAARLIGVPAGGSWDPAMPPLRVGVQALADRLTGIAATYRTGEIPHLLSRHDVRLFNTYRSHCFPAHYPLRAAPPRATPGASWSRRSRRTAVPARPSAPPRCPGITRGEHFHLAKVERFVVLRGSAEISLRRVGDTEVLRFPVSGDEPVLVDMPTMWAHKLVNTGPDELVTMFWTNEIFDPDRPDTWPEAVVAARPAPVAVGA